MSLGPSRQARANNSGARCKQGERETASENIGVCKDWGAACESKTSALLIRLCDGNTHAVNSLNCGHNSSALSRRQLSLIFVWN